MQPIKCLSEWLEKNANASNSLFTSSGLRQLLPDLSNAAFQVLLTRSVKAGLLKRVCSRRLYLYPKTMNNDGLMLFHAAALLRANEFNYISLETVLSDAGVISQIPINVITIMSSGRSNIIDCGEFGAIEFVHTVQTPDATMEQLEYDHACGMWRASVSLALRDMKATHRSCDLVDWDVVNEFI